MASYPGKGASFAPKPFLSDSTVARIAGNLLSGMSRDLWTEDNAKAVEWAVEARAIVAEVRRTSLRATNEWRA